MNYIRERLAENAHKQWVAWMKYLLGNATVNFDGSLTLSPEYVINLKRQIATQYQDLTEKEKDLDRAEADKIIELFHLPPDLSDLDILYGRKE